MPSRSQLMTIAYTMVGIALVTRFIPGGKALLGVD